MDISDVSENAGSLLLNGIRKVATEDGNGPVKECPLPEANPLEKDVRNEDSLRDDIDFADTAYQYLEVDKTAVNNISQKVINTPLEPTNLKDIDFDDISYPDFYPAEVLAEKLRIVKVLEALQREIESSRMGLDADKKAFEEETEAVRTRMRRN